MKDSLWGGLMLNGQEGLLPLHWRVYWVLRCLTCDVEQEVDGGSNAEGMLRRMVAMSDVLMEAGRVLVKRSHVVVDGELFHLDLVVDGYRVPFDFFAAHGEHVLVAFDRLAGVKS